MFIHAMNMCTHIHRMYNYIIISPFFCFFSFKIQWGWGVWLLQPLQPPSGSANEVSRPKGGEKTDIIYMYIMLSSCLKILISYGDRKPLFIKNWMYRNVIQIHCGDTIISTTYTIMQHSLITYFQIEYSPDISCKQNFIKFPYI